MAFRTALVGFVLCTCLYVFFAASVFFAEQPQRLCERVHSAATCFATLNR